MPDVIEIEKAVEQLSPQDLIAFRDWFVARDAAEWDRKFEGDVESGKLDSLGDEAIAEFRAGRCADL